MKKRNITYGYRIENGQLQLHPTESRIVREIFIRYAQGESLKEIAGSLSNRKEEFFPGKHNWDKARVKRVLDSRCYLGKDCYPQIVDQELFDTVDRQKAQANSNTTVIEPDIKAVKRVLYCGFCGEKLNLRTDRRLSVQEAWHCPACRQYIRISHDELKEKLFQLQTATMEQTSPIPVEEDTKIVSIKARRITHELHRQMDQGGSTEDELIIMALQCAAETYSSITGARHITDRLTAVLQNAGPLSSFDRSLFVRTVKRIRLYMDGSITMELKDGRLLKG